MIHGFLSVTQKLLNECLKLNDVTMMIYVSSTWGDKLLVERQPLLLQEVTLNKLMFDESYFPSGAVLIAFLVEKTNLQRPIKTHLTMWLICWYNLFHMLFFKCQVNFWCLFVVCPTMASFSITSGHFSAIVFITLLHLSLMLLRQGGGEWLLTAGSQEIIDTL